MCHWFVQKPLFRRNDENAQARIILSFLLSQECNTKRAVFSSLIFEKHMNFFL